MHAADAACDPSRMTRSARWLLAARLKTLGLSVTPVLAGSWLAARDGAWRTEVLIAAIVSAAAIQIGTNLWNDAADAARGLDVRERLGPPRMTGLGLLGAGEVRAAAAATFAVAAASGLVLVPIGGWPILALGLASLALGYLYSMGPYPLSASPLGELLVVAFFGVAAVAGTAYLHGAEPTRETLAVGALLGLPAAAVLLVNNHRDRVLDAAAGRRTLAILLGERRTRVLYGLLIGGALAGLAALLAESPLGLLAMAPAGLLGADLVRRMARLPVSRELNGLLARTALYQLALLAAAMVAAALGSTAT